MLKKLMQEGSPFDESDGEPEEKEKPKKKSLCLGHRLAAEFKEFKEAKKTFGR